MAKTYCGDRCAADLPGPRQNLIHALLDSQKIEESFQRFYFTKKLGVEPETSPTGKQTSVPQLHQGQTSIEVL